MAILEATKIHKSYGNKLNKQSVLSGLDIRIEEGEFVGIMGPSGSGKTTLLNVLSSIDKISNGSITIEGNEISNMKEKQLAEFRKNHLGFIFQEYNLLDTLTVKENILLPLSITNTPKKAANQKFESLAKELGILELKISTPMKSLAVKNNVPQQLVPSFMIQVLFLQMSLPGRWILNPLLIY